MRFADERLQELFTKCLNKWGQYLHDTDFEDLSALETFERELKYCELEDAFILAVESAINRQGEPCEWEKAWVKGYTTQKNLSFLSDLAQQEMDHDIEFEFCPMCGRKLEAK